MTRDELNVKLAAVITTLDEVGHSDDTTLYLGLGGNLDEWGTVKQVLLIGKLATSAGYRIEITRAGREMARKINAAAEQSRKDKMDGRSEYR